MITRKSLLSFATLAYDHLKKVCPVDTGNMKTNAIQFKQLSESQIEVSIEASIAPYVVYTNEKWLSPTWKGRKNPNEKWIDDAADYVAEAIRKKIGKRAKFTAEGVEDRRANKAFLDSPEGQNLLRRYGLI